MSPTTKMDYEADILEVLRAPQKTTLKKTAKKTLKKERNKGKLRIENRLTASIKGDPLESVEYETRDTKITSTDGSVIFEMRGAEVPKQWSRVASDVAVSKYFSQSGSPTAR